MAVITIPFDYDERTHPSIVPICIADTDSDGNAVHPSVVTPKPAIEGHFKTGHIARGQDLNVVVPRRWSARQEVFDFADIPAILTSPGRRIVATQGCDPSADPGPE
jgi:hypothetical protein